MKRQSQTAEKASPAEIQKALKGMHYPAKKEDIVGHAQEHGAGEEVMAVLNRLPNRAWKSPAELMKDVGKME
ncbi:MAG: hypothetical protein JWQ71_2664 [Pedosphaera sp.]|nr:hypothetical protein [Pedosphaera sp.]